jgi:hypothetical protein
MIYKQAGRLHTIDLLGTILVQTCIQRSITFCLRPLHLWQARAARTLRGAEDCRALGGGDRADGVAMVPMSRSGCTEVDLLQNKVPLRLQVKMRCHLHRPYRLAPAECRKADR